MARIERKEVHIRCCCACVVQCCLFVACLLMYIGALVIEMLTFFSLCMFDSYRVFLQACPPHPNCFGGKRCRAICTSVVRGKAGPYQPHSTSCTGPSASN